MFLESNHSCCRCPSIQSSMQFLDIHQRYQYPNKQTDELFRAVLSLETVGECEAFFRDLCTIQEIKALTERWHIAQMVWDGMPYRVIMEKTGASSTTIARVAHWVAYGQGGYQKVCTKMSGPSTQSE